MATQNLKQEVFETLSKGNFICSNSSDAQNRKLFGYLEEHYEGLYDYFSQINFILERGDEYFYFSRKEAKTDIERKLKRVFKWIDIVDFFKAFDNSFASGFRFEPYHIANQVKVDAVLKSKLKQLKKYTPGKESDPDCINALVEMLIREGYLELENEISHSYKVLSSFSYLHELIMNIHISEDIQNEIPE